MVSVSDEGDVQAKISSSRDFALEWSSCPVYR